MRLALVLSLILCGAAAAQTTPDNAASDNLRHRLLSMNLLNPPKRITLAPPVTHAGPNVCATPLLNATPMQADEKMQILSPKVPAESSREFVQVPAPACETKAR